VDPGTIIGLVLGIVAVFVAMILEGGNPAAFLLPSPLVLVIFGTLGVVMASTGLKASLRIPSLYIKAMTGKPPSRPDAIKALVKMAERARREGLLALEEEAQAVEDPFLARGLRLVVDGTDPELVKDILDLDVESMAGRHHENAALFTHASGFAPTIGIIGTVMGLVHVLENLSNPASLGPAIAAAFIATFFGVASANLIYLPVANKLKELSTHEADARTMMIEGILSIQAGDNPRIVEEKLKTFLEPGERKHFEAEGDADAGGAAAEKKAA
jgi:chemotaxis protein MotA